MATKKKASKAAEKKAAPAKATSKKAAAPKAIVNKKAVVPAKPTPKGKAVRKVGGTQRTSTSEKIAALQAEMAELKTEAVMEVKEKLSAARKVVQGFENELMNLTGKSAGRKTRRRH